ncbi:cell growth regulator with RING finger domain protein 1-like [Penaeus japonicus]|uniref:cell growth regulator with RING finger domain protein 1-like n=1 Tax=Penaeus japonicus TaxID=27405 RepID=UPI001C70FDEF|nr:cell growth regulator with RING finger domain protein 1-like [Penaeus japonicus]XP_042870145.1 cell growth regulator with RING finger domain protein 1-like [Penaeus japonicus]XP_042870146.1 cell growth regulator with RING finger domain protein 1-like [Penaeus japonicus]XP_042870147.1 cell growth regulator with RING finger domain protein 1-like [Penaeus japonicus]
MVAVLTAALMSAAEISNLCSALGVIICFVCMVVFILRLQGEDFIGTSVTHVTQPPVAQVAVQKVPVPFSLEIRDPSSASYKDIQLKVRSEVAYIRRSFWGVPSDQLHLLLNGTWPAFLRLVVEEPAVEADVIEESCREDNNDTADEVTHFHFKGNPQDLMLGSPPRKKYPLVVCVVRQDCLAEADPSTVGALISIVHIKDSECQVPTCILHQYLKQYSGQLTRLQALYTQGNKTNESAGRTMSASEASSSESEETNKADTDIKEEKQEVVEEEEEEEEDEVPIEEACVVCQVKRTSRALLPCRHVCVCNTCCIRLNNCPMCRARILSYFLVAPESADDSESLEVEIPDAPSLWQRVCHVITDMMPGDM